MAARFVLTHSLLAGVSCLLLGSAGAADFAREIQPILREHCYKCHGTEKQKGDVDLEAFTDASSIAKDMETWQAVVDAVRRGDMPPSKEQKMPEEAKATLAAWVEETLDAAVAARGPDPGPPIIRRLTHGEYRRAVRDLLGVDVDVASAVGMPEDPVGHGFENLAVALKTPPALTEKYLSAADEVLTQFAKAEPREGTLRAEVHKLGGAPEQARELLSRLLPRVYRRPVAPEEIARFAAVFQRALAQKKSPEEAFRPVLKAMLLSPNFLFRIERDRADLGASQPYRVDDVELATRLSFFLWSSGPDDELLRLAEQGKLSDPAVLNAHVARMLASPKAQALSEDFAAQWLQLRKLADARPTTEFFPTFTDALKDAMRQEALLFFDDLRTQDRPITALLDADYTFANGALAEHYGLGGISGGEFQRVGLKPEDHRGGLLGMGAVLAMTSHTFRTSPTQRGKYVLEVLLGTPPPPPPANVSQIDESQERGEAKSFREVLAQHAEDANCAGCHRRIDPLGFGLDSYDAIGRWRESTPQQPLDTAGVLPSGESFNGPAELKKVLAGKRERFVENLAGQMLAYALGRELCAADKPVVKEIGAALEKDGYRFSTLISGVVNAYPFQHRKNSDRPNVAAAR